ncbi:MAG: HEPN domain-containing protein [Bacteroidales bacterium]|nr:HEPN domain-containing protein [Bacteroidales bacterium]
MSLNDEERLTLVNLYLEKSKSTLHDAYIAAEAKSWSMAANRIYYSVFHAATALFIHDGINVGSHRGIKSLLGQNYIMTGKMSSDYSRFLSQMETLRDKADYNIMFEAVETDVLPNLEMAEIFIKEIERLVL